MSLLERLRADALTARKSKALTAGVLVTLLGEIDTTAKKLNPARDLTEDEVLAVVRKFLKNIDEALKVVTGEAAAKLQAEKAALEAYLPTQMTAPEIEAFARAKIAAGANLGAVMGALKSERAGQYDGKLASEIVRGLMAAA